MSFCVATLAAYGVDVWQQNKIKKQFMLIGVGFIFFSLLSIVHFLFHLPYIQKQLILGGTVFAVVAACLIAGKWINKKIIFLAILILTVGELFYYFHKFNPFVPKDLMFPSTQIESVLKQTLGVDRFIGYGPASIESNYSILFRLLSPDGYDPLYPRTYHEYTKSTSRSDVKLALKDAKQLDELGIKYILNRKESGADEKVLPPEKYSLTLEKNGWTVYENKNALPRAYIISGKERTPALIRKYEPGRIEIENPQIKGTLILSDNFYPGWNVIIDGSKGTTLKINEIFLGVEVKETDKSILFQYKPQSFYIGLALTIISLGVVIVFLVYSKKLWR